MGEERRGFGGGAADGVSRGPVARPVPRPAGPPPPPPRAPRPRDRRAAARYRAVIGRAWLGWREAGRFECRAAWVLDVSMGGALLAVEGAPPVGASALVQLSGPHLPRWFEVAVREVRQGETAVCAVRLAFPDGCPYELFMGLAYGRFPAGGAG